MENKTNLEFFPICYNDFSDCIETNKDWENTAISLWSIVVQSKISDQVKPEKSEYSHLYYDDIE